MAKSDAEILAAARAWWSSDIIDIHPGEIKSAAIRSRT
jgi:hypothetical protein